VGIGHVYATNSATPTPTKPSAATLGHKSMRVTLVYARIADRTIADQYLSPPTKSTHETP
jgi:hypothetical protein